MSQPFNLMLFSTDTRFITQAVSAGIGAIIVDWENIGKRARQAGFDTEINHNTIADLHRVRGCTSACVICRINSFGATTAVEIEQAISAGANELLLPMIRTVDEVEIVLEQVNGRCGVGILIETNEAVALTARLNQLPITRIYVGLNDLAIQRSSPSIFTALVDGTVEHIARKVTIPFGFGGLTLPDCGYPVPCRLLIGEMSRLGCTFSFLRRSFHRDIQGHSLAVEIPNIQQALKQATKRSPQAIDQDRLALRTAVCSFPQKPILTKGPYTHEQLTG